MKTPKMYSAEQIKSWDAQTSIKTESGEWWIPARPENYGCLICRFILAWKVFIGKCDALYWMD